MSSGGASLQPTFNGHVATTIDALFLFEACLQGHLSHVPRRPHDRERTSLIRSGCVFIYEENASGIKRWTDGVNWSPSRILGNFLVYRELDKPFPPGEKKKANRNKQNNNRRPNRPGEPYPRRDGEPDGYSPSTSQPPSFGGDRAPTEIERQLIGSLVDSYGFKHDGLVKKTMSVTVQGVTHHLVSYYSISDVVANNFRTPSQTDTLQYIRPRAELIHKQSFRVPIEEADDPESARDPSHPHYGFRMGPQGYVQNQYYSQPPYPSMSHYPPTSVPYSVNIPPMPQTHIYAPGPPTQVPAQREYGSYDQAQHHRGYEQMTHTLPSTQPGSIPPPVTNAHPERAQPQQNYMYPPAPIPPRQSLNLSPIPTDNRNGAPFTQRNYSLPPEPSPVDSHRQPQTQSSPVHIKYEDRRDTRPPQSHMYPPSRPQYYGDGATSQMIQRPYHAQQPITHWNGSTPGQ